MPPENISDAVAAACRHLARIAADEKALAQLQRTLSRPGVGLLARDGDEVLFTVPAGVREDFDEYQFFFMGRLLEVRRMGWMSNQYSLIDFPSELAAQRHLVQERFAALIVSTDDGLGWLAPGPWDALSDVQKAMCQPTFIEDNIRQFSI